MTDSRADRMPAPGRIPPEQVDIQDARSDDDLPPEDIVSGDMEKLAAGEDDELEGYDPSQRAEILEARQDLGGHPVIQNRLEADRGDPDGVSLS